MSLMRGAALAALMVVAAPAATAQNNSPRMAHAGGSAIDVNQHGYRPDGVKIAVVRSPLNVPRGWRLVDANGAVAAEGLTIPRGANEASGHLVQHIDFSDAKAFGDGFRLTINELTSDVFSIRPDVYAPVARDALHFFYHQRASVPIEARYVGSTVFARPAGHPVEKVTCYAGLDANKQKWPGCAYTLDVSRGWYDAGDQGKYVVNGGIAVWTLANAYERALLAGKPERFADGSRTIPEAGNGVSDLLDEVRFEMDFMLGMQIPDGAKTTVAVGGKPGAYQLKEIDGSGLAHHKMHDARWTALPTPPHLDREPRALYPPTTTATLNLAASAAQCARLFRTVDPAYADRCLNAAERAYAAASRNPNLMIFAEFDGGGGYGDRDASDEFFWAAAELFATTGKPEYLQAVRASKWAPKPDAPFQDVFWGSTASLGVITLATAAPALPEAERAAARAQLVRAADGYRAIAVKQGYRVPFDGKYGWGSSGDLSNRAMVLAYAHDFTGDATYRDAAIGTMDFLLGRNPLGRSFLSGFGERPMQNPHHRFWARQADPTAPPPPPGALSGGPNETNMSDPVAAAMKGKCVGQTCWADDINSYAMNEVAINWNAPFFWVAAYLAE